MRKFHEAKVQGRDEAIVWGSGRPMREFLHVDDLARAVAFCLDHYDEAEPINCGAGADVSIARACPNSSPTPSGSRGGFGSIRPSRTERRES